MRLIKINLRNEFETNINFSPRVIALYSIYTHTEVMDTLDLKLWQPVSLKCGWIIGAFNNEYNKMNQIKRKN